MAITWYPANGGNLTEADFAKLMNRADGYLDYAVTDLALMAVFKQMSGSDYVYTVLPGAFMFDGYLFELDVATDFTVPAAGSSLWLYYHLTSSAIDSAGICLTSGKPAGAVFFELCAISTFTVTDKRIIQPRGRVSVADSSGSAIVVETLTAKTSSVAGSSSYSLSLRRKAFRAGYFGSVRLTGEVKSLSSGGIATWALYLVSPGGTTTQLATYTPPTADTWYSFSTDVTGLMPGDVLHFQPHYSSSDDYSIRNVRMSYLLNSAQSSRVLMD